MPNCSFLLGDGLLRCEISHVQIPGFGHAVAIGVGFREVIAGVEKQHGNIRQALAQQIEHDHVFGLEAARDADRSLSCGGAIFGEHAVDRGFGGKRFELFGEDGRLAHGLSLVRIGIAWRAICAELS